MIETLTSPVQPEDLATNLNTLEYLINKIISDTINTMLVVKVIAVNESTIDVQPVIKDIDANSEPIDSYIIQGIRYMSWQYGVNCISAKPVVGDIGILVVSQQDTSGLDYMTENKETQCKIRGKYNIGDGIYIGGIYGLNTTPTQYINFTDDGITITSTKTVTVNAPAVNLGGSDGAIGVARIGDQVDLSTGKITSGSTKVKAL